MKTITKLLLLFSFLGFYQVSAQSPYDRSTYQVEQKVNFTAYADESGNKKIRFRLNNFGKNVHSQWQKYKWTFTGTSGNGNGDTYTYTGKKPTVIFTDTGVYQVCLSINGATAICKSNVFTVTETGLKVKYVNSIQWPHGNVDDVDSPFSYRKTNSRPNDFHRGLDITGAVDIRVEAIADGYISRVINSTTGAKWIFLKHTMDTPMWIHGQVITTYYSVYEHLNYIQYSSIRSKPIGAFVGKGVKIGRLGDTGTAGYPHTHLEIRVGTRYYQNYLNSNPNLNNYVNNEFVSPAAGDPVVDSRVNPLLFLNGADNTNSLRWSVYKSSNGYFYITVKSDFREDDFNKITIGFNGEAKKTLNFNTRDGMPVQAGHFGDSRYDDDRFNNDLIFLPSQFYNRDLLPLADSAYKIRYKLRDTGGKSVSDVYVKVWDMYGNEGVKVSSAKSAGSEQKTKEEVFSGNVLYPNPVKNSLSVSDSSYKNFVVYNYLGQKVKGGNILNNKIDVSTLKNNVYFVKISKEDGTYLSKRIVKE